MKEYLVKQGYEFKIITNIGSGIDYNKKEPNESIKLVIYGRVKKLLFCIKTDLLDLDLNL